MEMACSKVEVTAKRKGLRSRSLRSLQPCAPDWDLEHWDRDIWSCFSSSSSKDKRVCWLYRREKSPSQSLNNKGRSESDVFAPGAG